MKNRRQFIAGLMLAGVTAVSMTACGTNTTNNAAAQNTTQEAASENVAADASVSAAQAGGNVLTNGGVQLTIPEKYADLLVAETVSENEDGVLFRVAEKASIEAAKANDPSAVDYAGWLFSITKIDDERMHYMLCGDASGYDVFAKDGNGFHYVMEHPTDVTYVRESYDSVGDETNEDWKQFNELCEWAGTVKESFIAENAGLEAESYGNTDIDIYMNQIAYMAGCEFAMSSLEGGIIEPTPGVSDAAPFVDKLLNGVTYEYTDEEAPDGEYYVIAFPQDDVRLDFFKAEGKENYIRRVNGIETEDFSTMYKATFEDGTTKASEVVADWYADLMKTGTKVDSYNIEAPAPIEMEYISPDGWSVKYDPYVIESMDVNEHSAQFVYIGECAGTNMVTVSYVEGKKPAEALKELTADWGKDLEVKEFDMVGDVKGYSVEMPGEKEGSGMSESAVAREYKDGTVIFDFVSHHGNDEEMNIEVDSALAMVIDSFK